MTGDTDTFPEPAASGTKNMAGLTGDVFCLSLIAIVIPIIRSDICHQMTTAYRRAHLSPVGCTRTVSVRRRTWIVG